VDTTSPKVRDELHERLQAAVGAAYAVERELGRGGMAVVYRAADRKHGRPVAIKVLHPELAGAVGTTRFRREIEAAAGLRHPNVVPLHDSGAGEGLLYYVMPLVDGGSLRERLRREPQLPVEDTLRIARQVADALDHAHARGLVHRDIKPENILLDGGHALVSDFGIAHAMGAAAGEALTATGLALGTPAYMSPEQAAGERALDARSDVYSLACVVYEMLAGSPPYGGATPQAVLARKMVEPVPSLRVVRETLPAAVDSAVAKALAKSPADRFATATQFVGALERALVGPAPPERRPRPARRRAAAAVLTAALLAAAVPVGRRWWTTARPADGDRRIESLAVLPLENLSGDVGQDYFVLGMHGALVGELARVGGLRVVSRTSALRYRNSEKSVPEIAGELGVDAVVEGAVQRVGDSVRVQVQLVQARPAERNVWAHAYDRHVRDVPAVHADIARAVVHAVGAPARPDGVPRRAGARPVDPAAYDAYLRGRYYWSKRTEADLERALTYFRRALDHDPTFAPAYAGIGDAYVQLGGAAYAYRRPADTYPPARAAAERALQLDSTLADAHVTLAQVAGAYEWDWARAERSFRTAIALDPTYPTAHHLYSVLLVSVGRTEEALREAERARELDPLTPVITGNAARVAYFARRYDDAVAGYRTTLALGLSGGWAHVGIAMARAAQGQYGPALTELDSVRTSFGGLTEAVRGYIHARAGRREDAQQVLAVLVRRSRAEYVPPLYLAILHGALGDPDAAFASLERAVRERDGMLRFAKVEPMLDPVRGDARFGALVRRIGLQ
jgi:serine/threonine-protein kinase